MSKVIQGFARAERVLSIIAGVIIVAIMLLITADISLRFLFNSPIMGTLELTEFGMVVAFYIGLAYLQSQKGHITIEIVVDRLSARTRSVLEGIVYFLCLVVFGLMSWTGWVTAMDALQVGEITYGNIPFPTAPAKFILAIGCSLVCLQLVLDLGKGISKLWRGGRE